MSERDERIRLIKACDEQLRGAPRSARCSICLEPAGHTIGNCPACQNRDTTRSELLRTRKLLRELAEYFGDSCAHPLAAEVRERLKWPQVDSAPESHQYCKRCGERVRVYSYKASGETVCGLCLDGILNGK